MIHRPSLTQLIPVLQLAIGPVILISGIGLLLLSMTNRFGRTIDRARALAEQRRVAGEAEVERLEAQIAIILRRAVLLRRAIILAALSALFAAILIILLFITALLGLDVAWALALIFAGCLGAVIWSLAVFIADLNLSLHALRLELENR